jgi:hypothetical protein
MLPTCEPRPTLHRACAAGAARRARRGFHELGETFLERDAAGLESDRVHVGHVIADHVHSSLLIA